MSPAASAASGAAADRSLPRKHRRSQDAVRPPKRSSTSRASTAHRPSEDVRLAPEPLDARPRLHRSEAVRAWAPHARRWSPKRFTPFALRQSHRRRPKPPAAPAVGRALIFCHDRSRTRRRAQTDGPKSAPAFRGLHPAGIRHTHAGGLDPHAARSSLGLCALQGVLPRCGGPAFTAPPLVAFAVPGRERPETVDLQGIDHNEMGLSVSRLPTLMGSFAS
jgi:hypothetical protein